MLNSLQILQDKYPGATLLPLKAALREAALAPQTGYNRLSDGRGLPFSAKKQGKQWVVHLLDLAVYMESMRGQKNEKKRRGRPTKAAQVAAHAGAERA